MRDLSRKMNTMFGPNISSIVLISRDTNTSGLNTEVDISHDSGIGLMNSLELLRTETLKLQPKVL